MDPFTIGMLISSIFSLVGSAVSTGVNSYNVDETNKLNKQIADEANAAQAAESQKAYDRSKATNQVALLRQAGMSHAGALNVLSGGGSYSPAPVNTAQMQPFTMENPFAGIADIIAGHGSNSAQMKQTKEQFEQSLEETKRSNEANEKIQRENVEGENKVRQADVDMKRYELGMKQLTDNKDNYALYESLSQKVDPAKYSTSFEYISAIKESTNKETIPSAVYEQLTNQWNIANSGKLTTSQTNKTDKETDILGEQFKQIEQSVKEFLSYEAKDARKGMLLSDKAQAELNKLLAEHDMSIREYKDSLEYVFDEHGKLKPNGWTKTSDKASRFWNTVFSVVPKELIVEIVGAALK